jgi:hypothetical protein
MVVPFLIGCLRRTPDTYHLAGIKRGTATSNFHVQRDNLLGRPPYGAVNRAVQVAASEARLRDVVLWSASMYQDQLTTYDHRPLRAGEIVILHWIPGLYDSLVNLLAMASAEGLHPAPLAASLSPSGSS